MPPNVPRSKTFEIPRSVKDKEWMQRAKTADDAAKPPRAAVRYAGCDEVRAAGKAPHADEPGDSEE